MPARSRFFPVVPTPKQRVNQLPSVAIVGGGPAGSLAASLLSAAGSNVHLFDEKLAWEKPCGGGVTHKALEQYPFLRDAGAETRMPEHEMPGRNMPDRRMLDSQIIDQCELISPSGQRVRFHLQHPVAIFSRLSLNGLLLDRARSAGANLHCERVTRITGTPGNWKLLTTHAEYFASFLILAAGARNPFRGQFASPISPADLMVTAGYFIPTRTTLMQIQFLRGLTGYIWVFPRPDHVSAGIAARMGETSTSSLRQRLEQWLAHNGFSLDGATFYSHILPSLRTQTLEAPEVSGPGWAMIGDSAGLVDPITGEGLYYALRSAELCAEALMNDRPLDYKLHLQEELLPELKLAARVSQRFYHGQVFGESVAERMIALTAQSESFRDLMSDLFAGIQGYRDLKSRLYRILPSVMAESLKNTFLGSSDNRAFAAIPSTK